MNTLQIPQFPGMLRKNDGLFLFGALQPKPFVSVYRQSAIEVVHGPSCRRPVDEIYLDRCDNDGIPVIERRGGGGTVVLAPGMVVTIVVGQRIVTHPATTYFKRIHDVMIGILERIGIRGIEKSGISDLSLHDRKILGSSLYMGTNPPFFYYQSSLLVAPDLSLFEKYLRYPPREPDYRRKRSHGSFCTSLCEEGYTVTADAIYHLFSKQLTPLLLIEEEKVPPGSE